MDVSGVVTSLCTWFTTAAGSVGRTISVINVGDGAVLGVAVSVLFLAFFGNGTLGTQILSGIGSCGFSVLLTLFDAISAQTRSYSSTDSAVGCVLEI